MARLGSIWRVHAHVVAANAREAEELRWFRDRLRASRALLHDYASEKRSIVARGIRDSLDYSNAKKEFILRVHRAAGRE